jgi:hypothetical protein
MAKTATAPARGAKTAARGKAAEPVTRKPKKGPVALDELNGIVAETLALEQAERAKSGSQHSWLTLVGPGSPILSPKDPKFIKGVRMLDFVLPDKKLRLGPKVTVSVLGMFKLYQQTLKKKNENDMPPVIGFWMPEDAEQVPLAPGDNFTREFMDREGKTNSLIPVHWVPLYIHGHEDLTDVVLAFRSRGNEVYRELFKLMKRETKAYTELRFTLTNQDVANTKYNKTDYYPKFDIEGRNYRIDEDGQIELVKGGMDATELQDLLTRSRDLQKEYAEKRMVAQKNVAAILGLSAQPALPPGRADDEFLDEDDDDLDL